MTHRVKHANIRVFSNTYFHVYLFGILSIYWKIWLTENLLYLHTLCSVKLSLLVNLGTTFFSIAPAKFCASRAKLAALCRTEIFKKKLYNINEWNKLDPEIRRTDSCVSFRNNLASLIKPTEYKTFSI